jgi:redox-sensitive bicupin YhaK (pirin superfamily)
VALTTSAGRALEFPPRRDGTMRKRQALGPDRARQLNPLLSLVESWMRPPGGYDEHVHRGYQTVTLVLEGQVACEDALGGRVVLEPGDLQWVTAGHGLSHRELPEGDAEAHLLQLWLNLPMAAKRHPARVETRRAAEMPVTVADGRWTRVLAGALEEAPLRVLEVRLDPDASFELPVPAGHLGLVYLVDGEVMAGLHPLQAGGLLELAATTPELLHLESHAAAHLLVLTALPLLEPVEVSGPFILNTKAEVKEAYDDFRRGWFERATSSGSGPP